MLHNNLFNGYLKLNGKRSVTKFDDAFPEIEDVIDFQSYGGVLSRDTILIDVDDYKQSEILMNIVEDLQLNCLVTETSRGKHFFFRNYNIVKCSTGCRLAIGIDADIKVGIKNSYAVLKKDGVNRKIIFDKDDDAEYQPIPRWLYPVRNVPLFSEMVDGDGRNNALFKYILTLQRSGFSQEEIKQCFHIINKYVLQNSLSDRELETILRDDAFSKESFFEGRQFLHDKFGNYLISKLNIIKINNQLHIYQDGVYTNRYDVIEYEMIKCISNITHRQRSEVLSYIEIVAPEKKVTEQSKYIAFKNGLYDIRNKTMVSYSPNIILTNKINYNYNPKAYSETMEKALLDFSKNSKEIKMLLEEVGGYTLFARNELRKAFILTGEKANGKSTFIYILKTMLGENNICSLDMKELSERFKTSELYNKLACLGDDISDGYISDSSLFKKLCSGDTVTAEKKGKNPFQFSNYAKMIFSANDIPKIKDKSGAVLDRLIIIPFTNTFNKNSSTFDPWIKDKLSTDDAIEYFIKLSVDGLHRVLENQEFTVSNNVTNAMYEYKVNNNPILGFFDEIQSVDEEVINTPIKDVYLRYSVYCSDTGIHALSNSEFSKQIKKYFSLTDTLKRHNGIVKRVYTYAND